MKKMQSIMTGVAVLAALALPMTAMAANKLVVNGTDGTTPVMAVTDTGAVGAGTATPGGQLEVAKQWPFSAGTNTLSLFTSYGDASRLTIRAAQGTMSSPLNSKANNQLGNVNFRGFDGTNFSTSGVAAITGNAEADFTPSSQPTRLSFFTTPVNAIAGTERLRISSDGRLRILGQPSAPANNATCTAGDLILDAVNATLYLCASTNSWRKLVFSTY